ALNNRAARPSAPFRPATARREVGTARRPALLRDNLAASAANAATSAAANALANTLLPSTGLVVALVRVTGSAAVAVGASGTTCGSGVAQAGREAPTVGLQAAAWVGCARGWAVGAIGSVRAAGPALIGLWANRSAAATSAPIRTSRRARRIVWC